MNVWKTYLLGRSFKNTFTYIKYSSSNMDRAALFQSLGLTEQKARETMKNQSLANKLETIATTAGSFNKIAKPSGTLLYTLASSSLADEKKLIFLVEYIMKGNIVSVNQLNAGIDFLKNQSGNKVDHELFDKECGINVSYSPDEIEDAVEAVMKQFATQIKEKRYHVNVGMLLGAVSKKLKWVDMKHVRSEIDMQLLDVLGPKTEDDRIPLKKAGKKEKQTRPAKEETQKANAVLDLETITKMIDPKNIYTNGEAAKFHKPGENFKTEGYVMTQNTMKHMKGHLDTYGSQVRTRFPPEPNGILHIGHAKAINFNFGYAKAYNGVTFLRYDDTNPEKEEEKFFRGIREMVEWLGFTPYKVTHASDYFNKLYAYAIDLIKRDLAYVCHQEYEELKGHNPPPSPWRNRPNSESLQLFEDMKNGKLDEGEATLRMKMTMEDGKMDPVAYRIKFTPHHRTGDKWCIYPTYDFTHCLNDSLEHITHSLCTKEFQSRRSAYYWLCNSLDVYCPVQWEYGRLNLNYTVVSKRKIAKLISNKIVADWDDPRLFTLTALKRRGIPAEAINLFCAKIGVTGSQTILDPSMLDASVREVLNVTAQRAMAVLDPLKVVITNIPDERVPVDVPNIPNDEKSVTHSVVFGKIIYIDQTDFREATSKDYKRLAVDQPVGLRHAGKVLTVTDVIKESDGSIRELHATCEPSSSSTKPKAYIQWVCEPLKCEVRLYEKLFKHKNPEDVKEVAGGFLTDINENSLSVISNAYVDGSVKDAPVFSKFQFERIGYFAVDKDSTSEKMVFNRTISLKEDSSKD